MSSKTFECMNPVVELTISKGSNDNINFIINHELRGSTKATLEKSAGADAALAILEAAGYGDTSDDMSVPEVLAFNAMHKLQEVVDVQERITAKAKEQEELEAEALAFFNAYDNVRTISEPPLESFVGMPRYVKDRWLAVARKARELAKEASK